MFEITESFSPLPVFGHPVQQGIMTLIAIVDGQLIPVGSGFVIAADGLMMTASHVLEEAIKKIMPPKDGKGEFDDISGFYALYLTAEKHGIDNQNIIGGLLPIVRIFFSKAIDIGYCWIGQSTVNGEPIKFPVLRLSPGLPKIGENVLGFGYYGMSGHLVGEVDGQIQVNYTQQTAFTKGQIVEVHATGRDKGMLDFPCFRTEARFEHGMSGGPIMNENGAVCGVICSSFPLIEDNPEYISYGSLLWPAMGTSIEVAISGNTKTEFFLVYDLVKMGFVLTDESIENVTVTMKEDGKREIIIRETRHNKSQERPE